MLGGRYDRYFVNLWPVMVRVLRLQVLRSLSTRYAHNLLSFYYPANSFTLLILCRTAESRACANTSACDLSTGLCQFAADAYASGASPRRGLPVLLTFLACTVGYVLFSLQWPSAVR